MKILKKIVLYLSLLILVLIIGIAAFIWFQFDGMKYVQLGKTISPKTLPFAIVFEDRNGKEFFRSFGNQNREWIDIEDIPQILKDATILLEDKRFYDHTGVDFQGIFRAAVINLKAGYIKQGGSTLTQQIAKKAFLSDERTFARKFKELFLSYGIEQSLTKDQILELSTKGP